MKQMRDEEDARVDAVEVGKAAERFKNLEAEQNEWEEKYGHGASPSAGPSSSGHQTVPDTPRDVPQLEFARESRDKRFESTHSLLSLAEKSRYEAVPQGSPTADVFPRARDESPREELREPANDKGKEVGEDKVLEDQMKLLDEVKRARLEIRSSIDRLRTTSALSHRESHSGASTPTMDRFGETHSRRISGTSSKMLLDRPVSILEKPSPTQSTFGHSPAQSPPQPPKSEWEQYVSSRNIVSSSIPEDPSAAPSMRRQSSYDRSAAPVHPEQRMQRTTSFVEPRATDFGVEHLGPVSTYPARESRRESPQTLPRPMSNYELLRPASQYDAAPASHRTSQYAPGVILGSAAGGGAGAARGSQSMPRAMTYEELADRHRKRISALQDPVSSKMNEEVQLAAAKERWERQKRTERDEMRKREAEKMERAKEREREREGGHEMQRPRKEVMKSTDEWRRSVAGGLDRMAGSTTTMGQAQQKGSMGPPGVPASSMAGKGKRRMSSHLAN